jgi:NADPH:quinone reductase-like Zn-dependent oxidoreductase
LHFPRAELIALCLTGVSDPTGLFKAVLQFQLPATLGSDLAGVVIEVGRSVTRFKVGDAVFANIFDLRGYDAVLGTVRGDAIEKSIGILKARGTIVSLVGPLDAAFARARRLNFVLTFVFAMMSRKIMRLAKNRNVAYSFLFARPDGDQLAAIGELLETQRVRPVIDKVFPFEQAKDALVYLAQGHAKGKVVVQVR